MGAMTLTDGTVRMAARRLGIPPAEYRAHREAGDRWCSGCQDWHYDDGETFVSASSNAGGASECRLSHQERERQRNRKVRDITDHVRAVAKFCWGCEPEGVCRTPDCALRPVSPLPVSTHQRFSAA